MNQHIYTVPLEQLVEDPANARQHGERNLAAIRESLTRFGQVEPLVVRQGTNVVLGGNGRLAVMRALGWRTAEVVYYDGTDAQATALALALNRTAELADWDKSALADALQSLDASALDGLGWTEGELLKLLGGSPDLPDEPTEVDEPTEAAPDLTHVEQVPLYFRGAEKADFLRLVEALLPKLGVDNVTDAVVACVRFVGQASGVIGAVPEPGTESAG